MPYLKKIALIENLADNHFVQRYAFSREDGGTGQLEISPAEADKWEAFRDRLKNLNAHPSLLQKSTIQSAAASQPQTRQAYAAASGWHPGYKTFVLPDRVVGRNTKKLCGLPDAKIIVPRAQLRPRGNSGAWLKSVASIASKSSGTMLAISCAFAAPLARIANEQSFGLCLAGKAGGGKTTATLAASSVFATGEIDQLLSWNATLAGLEPALRSHNDCLLVLDDLNKLPVDSEKEQYHVARNFAYNLNTGSAKRRSPTFDETSNNGAQYRIISLTSAEITLAELAAQCGIRKTGGSGRRLIDLPIYFDGLDHIFDRATKAHRLSQSAIQRLLSSLQMGCAKNHGHIFRRYISFLIRSKSTLPTKIADYVSQFGAEMTAANTVDADIIRKFGFIYAGGALAIEGVGMPWRRSALLQAIVKCCTAALEVLDLDKRLLDMGMKELKARLQALPKSPGINRNDWPSIDGFREPLQTKTRCIIKTDKFNRIFDNALQRKIVMEELEQRNFITRSRSQEYLQFVWPDGKRRRSLEIYWDHRRLDVR
jgi:Domain of unknown function (DUF927)